MAVFNCGLDRRWCKDSTAFTGLSNEKNTMPFISANGYYGYLPVYADDTNAMETSDINDSMENNRVGTFPSMTESPCSGNTMQHLSNHRPNGRCIVQKITALPRKRNSSEEVDENHKRLKREESPFEGSGGYEVPLLQPTYNSDYHYPRCTMEPESNSLSVHENEPEHSLESSSVDLMEKLLKQIHGCDMYNFYTDDL